MSYLKRRSTRYSRSRSPYMRYRRSVSRGRSRSVEYVENPGNNLYVTRLSRQTTERDLEKHFSTEGTVEDVHLVVNQWTGEPRGFGFVTMSSLREANRCVKYLDRSVLVGRAITVEKVQRGRSPTSRYSSERGRRLRRSYSPCNGYRHKSPASPCHRRHRSHHESRYHSRSPSHSPYRSPERYHRRDYSRSASPRSRPRLNSPKRGSYSHVLSKRRRRRSYSRGVPISISPTPRRSYSRGIPVSISPIPRRTYSPSYSPMRRRVTPSSSPIPRRSYSPGFSPRRRRRNSSHRTRRYRSSSSSSDSSSSYSSSTPSTTWSR